MESYHRPTSLNQRIERLELLLEVFLQRHGAEHPLTQRIAQQLDRIRGGRSEVAS